MQKDQWFACFLVACAVLQGAAQTAPPVIAPTIDCVANPAVVDPGGSARIVSHAVSRQNRPLTFSYRASQGRVAGATNTAIFDSTGVPPGLVTITCTVTDDKGQSASSSANVTVTRGD